jgi:hypothetical protein
MARSATRARVLWVEDKLVFVVLHSADGWRVDNTYCQGKPQTTIYQLQNNQTGASATQFVCSL